jgi:hypothetical protein
MSACPPDSESRHNIMAAPLSQRLAGMLMPRNLSALDGFIIAMALIPTEEYPSLHSNLITITSCMMNVRNSKGMRTMSRLD